MFRYQGHTISATQDGVTQFRAVVHFTALVWLVAYAPGLIGETR